MCDLNSLKERFLDKYNPNRCHDVAVTEAIGAAVKRNVIYKEDVSSKERKKLRDEWGVFLKNLAVPKSDHEYEDQIESLKKRMNELFRSSFSNEFRISHAQKSISVYFKHLWCMGGRRQPQCPVDRGILKVAKAQPSEQAWGYVNSIEEHRKKIDILRCAANGQHLAVWELRNFPF